MSTDERNVAFPKLYGAPAYGRPPVPLDEVPRPPDPDDLPLAVEQTEEERALASELAGRSYLSISRPEHTLGPDGDGIRSNGHGGRRSLLGRQLRLRSLAGRWLGGER